MIKTQFCLMLQYNVLVVCVLYITTAVKNKMKFIFFFLFFFFKLIPHDFDVNYKNGSNSNVLFGTSLVDSICYKYREQRKNRVVSEKKTT